MIKNSYTQLKKIIIYIRIYNSHNWYSCLLWVIGIPNKPGSITPYFITNPPWLSWFFFAAPHRKNAGIARCCPQWRSTSSGWTADSWSFHEPPWRADRMGLLHGCEDLWSGNQCYNYIQEWKVSQIFFWGIPPQIFHGWNQYFLVIYP